MDHIVYTGYFGKNLLSRLHAFSNNSFDPIHSFVHSFFFIKPLPSQLALSNTRSFEYSLFRPFALSTIRFFDYSLFRLFALSTTRRPLAFSTIHPLFTPLTLFNSIVSLLPPFHSILSIFSNNKTQCYQFSHCGRK